jgi:hypothetical protein
VWVELRHDVGVLRIGIDWSNSPARFVVVAVGTKGPQRLRRGNRGILVVRVRQ